MQKMSKLHKKYKSELLKLVGFASAKISNILPSDWAEKNRMMTSENSSIPGPFSYKNSPYSKEIVDCLSPTVPANKIAVMKAAQIGFSTGVIENGIGWIISQDPGNTLFLVGHDDLVKDSMDKMDKMIDGSSIRHLIRTTSGRARNNKSGDTDKMKNFPGGYLKLGITNHKTLRNISMKYGFIDDYEGMKGSTKEAGSTQKMIEARFMSFAKSMKLFFISTPELEETSNIEPVYLMGDQRKFHVPCPCCGDMIVLEWEIESNYEPSKMVGITWSVDENGLLIEDSVGYTCQECDGFFDDSIKSEIISNGEWRPTAVPKEPTFRSYHISALYAPPYMFGWDKYVRDYIEANPIGQDRDEELMKTFYNLVLGKTYKAKNQTLSSTKLQQNVRSYEIGTIPEKQSQEDGNGRIVMLTCGSDLNGKEDDARLDYEIVAYSETGATYSIDHGSIGTFVNKDKDKGQTRLKYTYRRGAKNNVWDVFEEIITKKYVRDSDGKSMKIFITGLDTGYQTTHAYQFMDDTNANVVGLKGERDDQFQLLGQDKKKFKYSNERRNLFLVSSNLTKDVLSKEMELNWSPDLNSNQPFGFMNFPQPSGGKYLYDNFFSHFEAEEKRFDKNNKYTWIKTAGKQNHLFDCRLYALVVRDILLDQIFKKLKIKNGIWSDYCDVVLKKKK